MQWVQCFYHCWSTTGTDLLKLYAKRLATVLEIQWHPANDTLIHAISLSNPLHVFIQTFFKSICNLEKELCSLPKVFEGGGAIHSQISTSKFLNQRKRKGNEIFSDSYCTKPITNYLRTNSNLKPKHLAAPIRAYNAQKPLFKAFPVSESHVLALAIVTIIG